VLAQEGGEAQKIEIEAERAGRAARRWARGKALRERAAAREAFRRWRRRR
jgi:hypothetical protein